MKPLSGFSQDRVFLCYSLVSVTNLCLLPTVEMQVASYPLTFAPDCLEACLVHSIYSVNAYRMNEEAKLHRVTVCFHKSVCIKWKHRNRTPTYCDQKLKTGFGRVGRFSLCCPS